MATADVLSQSQMPKPSFRPIITGQASKRKLENVEFNPKQHLAFEEPESVLMMTDIGYSEDTGISPVAVSQPFPLFSTEAVQKFRDECLSDDVFAHNMFKSNIAACQMRGYVPKYAPFMYDAFNHPETLGIISKIAGVDLIPAMNYEIGHVNVSVKSEKEVQNELASVERERKKFEADEGISGCPFEDDKPIVGWHTDSYPFVCVVMLSDCTDMIGGETALRTKDGSIMKVRGPDMGCAVVMQGRYITHQALRALGAQERITIVTSLRPKSPHLADDAFLATVRGISDLSELYYQFGRYRLEIMEERIRDQIKRLTEAHTAGRRTNTKALKRFLEEQERFLFHTNKEMHQEEDVVFGLQPKLDIPDAAATEAPDGKSAAKKAKLK